ncbi:MULTISPECIES: RBBP9/YdeN family alpha/beta hydrolase [unclassified Acinetobacter]|uniref:RBBP9/YdeN family alpha/beta hydrolase n=1 Tax=unclassified Acinetobacter TaxID=196816 RepID=UPI0029342F03|nr:MULTISPECIES: alpha/beta hydrolase [unclassified Acinetobacter]WOE33136.1 alpha/beta hydrolase [Acinetobacter sp. SAAs470]WOE39802.1 alpha/beta hydrolase [Acinetobacter sp. SAAs474]
MEKIYTNATVLIIPGLRDHVEDHWQTLLASRLHKVYTVAPTEVNKLSCIHRIQRIQQQLEKISGPVTLVAHSAGVLMTIHWAAQYQHHIVGALLVTPPDLNQSWPSHYPSTAQLQQQGWSPLPTQTLAFPSIVVASRNDELAHFNAVTAMANNWGSTVFDAGAVQHLNPAAGFGNWPLAEKLILQLDQAVNSHDSRA